MANLRKPGRNVRDLQAGQGWWEKEALSGAPYSMAMEVSEPASAEAVAAKTEPNEPE